jgi:uncharacterized membrane protein YagU involved in acid resistance
LDTFNRSITEYWSPMIGHIQQVNHRTLESNDWTHLTGQSQNIGVQLLDTFNRSITEHWSPMFGHIQQVNHRTLESNDWTHSYMLRFTKNIKDRK